MFHFTKTVLQNGYKILFACFKWMRFYANHPTEVDINVKYPKVSQLIGGVMKSFGADYHIVGLENLPNEASMLVCNHLSAFDPLALISVINKPMAVVAKREIEHYPFVAKCFKSIDGLFLDRKDLKQSLRIMMKVEEDLKIGNKNWLIFPEGTRNKDPKRVVGEFHQGTFRAPTRAETPIVPICIYGTQRITKLKPQYSKYPVYIEIGTPLFPSEYANMTTQEIALLMHDRIQKMLTYNARAYDDKYMVQYNEKKYRQNEY